MIIPKADRKLIYESLFKDGVLVAKKDFEIVHPTIQVKNLYVIKAMQSLTTQLFVKTKFNWNWYYYTLTPEGLEYLRTYLNLPIEVIPETYKKQTRAAPGAAPGAGQQSSGAYRAPRGDRDEYRRSGPADKETAPGGYKPSFASATPAAKDESAAKE